MVGFAEKKSELDALDVSVFAASVDPLEKAKEVADEVYFPIGFALPRDIATQLDAWWEDRRQIIQPTQFVLNPDNNVVASTYSDGPLGRIIADDVIRMVTFLKSKA